MLPAGGIPQSAAPPEEETMTKLASILVILLLASSAFAADVAGKWKSAVEGPDGKMEITFNFKVDGGRLTGTSTSPMGEATVEGKLDGDNVEFTVIAGDFKILHKGAVSGKEMKLKVEIGDRTMDMVATKID
jgi:hypothetical protein